MKKFISVLMLIAMLGAIIAVPVTAADVPYDNIIGLYNMNGGLTNSIDGKSGTLYGGASIVQDAQRGSVLFLDNPGGVAGAASGNGWENVGQWAELSAPHIPDSDEMTISIWFKTREEVPGAIRIFEAADAKSQNSGSGSPDRFIAIHPYRDDGVGTQATINCNDMTGIADNNRDRAFSSERAVNEWVHVAWVINKGKPNVMYVNGKAYESTQGDPGDPADDAVFSPKDILSSPEGVRNALLGRPGEETGGSTSAFDGWLSDVAIFDTALTADQVAALRTADLSGGIPTSGGSEEAANDEPEVQNDTEASVPMPQPAKTGDMTTGLLAIALISAVGVVVMRKRIAVK